MNDASLSWDITGAADAARARAAVAGVAARAGLPVRERLHLTTRLTRQLRQLLTGGGSGRLEAALLPAEDSAPARLRLRTEGDDPAAGPGRRWEVTTELPAGDEAFTAAGRALAEAARQPRDATDLAEALLDADEDLATALDLLHEQQELIRFHREELHHTNQGVLALHAELDAAGEAQRALLAAEQAARGAAESARRRLTFLVNASATLTASLDHAEVLHHLTKVVVPDYAATAHVWLVDSDRLTSGDGLGTAPVPVGEAYLSHPAAVAARTGRPQHAAGHPGELPGVDDLPASRISPDRPLLAIPLIARRTTLGVLALTPPGDRFDPDDTVMLMELARRAAIAIDNALRYEQERDIAETLQRALLPDLPQAPGLRLAARYLPATRGMNIGGDWYDAFTQPDGSLVTVIGDVTGHGLHAAVMMSQLRHAVRAFAIDGDSPGRLLTRLHQLLHHLQPDLYATAVIARFRPGEPTVTWAAAGHPPPVLREADGRVRVLDTKPAAMLGIPLNQSVADHTVTLDPGAALLLYTDGLVERRPLGLDPGIDRLCEALATLEPAVAENPAAAAEALLDHMLPDAGGEDDVCLLLCQAVRHTAAPAPEHLTLPHPARPAEAEPAG